MVKDNDKTTSSLIVTFQLKVSSTSAQFARLNNKEISSSPTWSLLSDSLPFINELLQFEIRQSILDWEMLQNNTISIANVHSRKKDFCGQTKSSIIEGNNKINSNEICVIIESNITTTMFGTDNSSISTRNSNPLLHYVIANAVQSYIEDSSDYNLNFSTDISFSVPSGYHVDVNYLSPRYGKILDIGWYLYGAQEKMTDNAMKSFSHGTSLFFEKNGKYPSTSMHMVVAGQKRVNETEIIVREEKSVLEFAAKTTHEEGNVLELRSLMFGSQNDTSNHEKIEEYSGESIVNLFNNLENQDTQEILKKLTHRNHFFSTIEDIEAFLPSDTIRISREPYKHPVMTDPTPSKYIYVHESNFLRDLTLTMILLPILILAVGTTIIQYLYKRKLAKDQIERRCIASLHYVNDIDLCNNVEQEARHKESTTENQISYEATSASSSSGSIDRSDSHGLPTLLSSSGSNKAESNQMIDDESHQLHNRDEEVALHNNKFNEPNYTLHSKKDKRIDPHYCTSDMKFDEQSNRLEISHALQGEIIEKKDDGTEHACKKSDDSSCIDKEAAVKRPPPHNPDYSNMQFHELSNKPAILHALREEIIKKKDGTEHACKKSDDSSSIDKKAASERPPPHNPDYNPTRS